MAQIGPEQKSGAFDPSFIASAAWRPLGCAYVALRFGTLAVRQASGACWGPDVGCLLAGAAGNAAPPARVVISISLKNRFPTWLTTIRCWKDALARLMPVEPRNEN